MFNWHLALKVITTIGDKWVQGEVIVAGLQITATKIAELRL